MKFSLKLRNIKDLNNHELRLTSAQIINTNFKITLISVVKMISMFFKFKKINKKQLLLFH